MSSAVPAMPAVSMVKAALLAVALVVLAGCGDKLVTTYATTEPGSVNGCAVLRRVLEQRTDLRNTWRLSPRLEECELLVHVARERALPNEETCDWLRTWLTTESDRQAVLVLRDGNLAPWLCRRWAAEARAEAVTAPAAAEQLGKLASDLERRATSEEERETEKTNTCDLFSLERGPALEPTAITGLELTQVPQVMRVASRVTHAKAEPLISVTLPGQTQPQPWAVTIPVGNGRLVVVVDALPLLDGAQPDPAARRLLTTLVDALLEEHGDTPKAAWVAHLTVPGEVEQPNPMLALLTRPPVSWITWHLIALLVVLALAGAVWLGRREAPRDARHDRFSRHVQALAGRLRDAGQAGWCARIIARVVLRDRVRGEPPTSAAAACDWLAQAASTSAAPDPRVPSAVSPAVPSAKRKSAP